MLKYSLALFLFFSFDVNSQWLYNSIVELDEARDISSETGKPVVIYFHNDLCFPCRKLDSTTFKDERIVQRMTTEFVSINLNGSHEDIVALSDYYKVGANPTLLFIGNDEEILEKFVGYTSADSLNHVFDNVIARRTKYMEMQNLALNQSIGFDLMIDLCYYKADLMELDKDFISKVYTAIPKDEYSKPKVKDFISDFLLYQFENSISLTHPAFEYLYNSLKSEDSVTYGRLMFFLGNETYALTDCSSEAQLLNIAEKMEKIQRDEIAFFYNQNDLRTGMIFSVNSGLLAKRAFYSYDACYNQKKYRRYTRMMYRFSRSHEKDLDLFLKSLENLKDPLPFDERMLKKGRRLK